MQHLVSVCRCVYTERDRERRRDKREGRRERDTSSRNGEGFQAGSSVCKARQVWTSRRCTWRQCGWGVVSGGVGVEDEVGKMGETWTVENQVHSLDLTLLARGAIQVFKSGV